MRIPLLILLACVLAACGDARSDDGAYPTPATSSLVTTATAEAPTGAAFVASTIVTADTQQASFDTAPTTATEATATATVAAAEQSTVSDGGLHESVSVSDSVTIIVSDPED